jgi:hypothetical protein
MFKGSIKCHASHLSLALRIRRGVGDLRKSCNEIHTFSQFLMSIIINLWYQMLKFDVSIKRSHKVTGKTCAIFLTNGKRPVFPMALPVVLGGLSSTKQLGEPLETLV